MLFEYLIYDSLDYAWYYLDYFDAEELIFDAWWWFF